MSTLDDALNSPAPVFHAADLVADWKEMPASQVQSSNRESVHLLSHQMTGAYSVDHSLDDGLPDPVTMTNGNDASGILEAELVGRGALIADVMGWRTATTSTGTAVTSIAYTIPSDAQDGDQLFLSVTVNSLTAVLTPDALDGNQAWRLLTTIDDSPWKTYVYTRTNWPAADAKPIKSSASVNHSTVVTAFYTTTADGTVVGVEPGTAVSIAETVSGTTHTTPAVTLAKRGYVLAVFGTSISAGPWLPGAGMTELGEAIGTSSDTMVEVSALREAGTYTVTGTSTVATAVATIQAIPILIKDRKAMDARAYFSPFNRESPIQSFDRDTAETMLTFNVLTEAGIEGTVLHKGQMVDIPLSGRTAKLEAMSKTRLDLDRSVTMPVVSGYRENCNVDWLATWLMARGGQFVGPAPGPQTRYWAPLYGSVHAHMEPPLGYNYAIVWDTAFGTPTGPYGLKPPRAVPGPFFTGMFACQTATRTESIRLNPIMITESREVFPGLEQTFDDFFSLKNSAGRITFWLRGDAAVAAPSYLPSGDDYLLKYRHYCMSAAGGFLGTINIAVRSADRHLEVFMGSDVGGSAGVLFSSGLSIPLQTDGAWHFYGIAWDYAAGVVKVKKDNQESINYYWFNNGLNNTTALPASDEALVAAGGKIYQFVDSHLPLADVQIESGPLAFSNPWTRHYPSPDGQNATMRPTYQTIQAVAESTPVNLWEALSKLAQATMSAYRTNENDGYEFLPLSYFGETAQLTSTMVADTEVNAGELSVTHDPSRTRNSVTVQFNDTRVDTNFGPVMSISSALEIPRGVTTMVFPLDIPIAEIHGATDPLGVSWNISHLTAAQLATPSTIPTTIHYMTVNTRQEGTGTGVPYIGGTNLTGRILGYTATTVTIKFTNKYTTSIWLANSADQVPFLRILGYAVRVVDGYVTERDAGSVGFRRERPLDVGIDWIQTRDAATKIAQWMVTALARPRAQISLELMGDPRRTPGQLITLADAEGTQADGTWRMLSVGHTVDQPKYVQAVNLVQVLPRALWDGLPGWDEAIWGE